MNALIGDGPSDRGEALSAASHQAHEHVDARDDGSTNGIGSA
jgi:hypothetical protein